MSEYAIDLWYEVAELQNTIVEEQGEIKRNDPRLWKPYLNKMMNEDWTELLTAMAQLHQQHPALFKDFHTRTIRKACEELIDADHPRVLDTKNNKGLEWNLFMVMREVWNLCRVERNAVSPREAMFDV